MGIIYLAHIAKKVLFVLTFFCFVAFTTNLMLAVHINCVHKSKEQPHSSPENQDCSLCQKLITTLAFFTIEQQILLVDILTEQNSVHLQQNVNLPYFHPETVSPRGPPA